MTYSVRSTGARARHAGALLLTTAALLPAQSTPTPNWAPRIDSVVRAVLAQSRTPGATVAIVADGRLAYAQGYGVANVETQQPLHADMLLRVGSVTKMFTGLLVADLAEQGKLDVQAPLSRYVPSLAGRKVGTVTTQQLMTHHAGWIDNAVAYGRMGEGALGEVMREVGDTLFFTEPGRTFSYSNPAVSMAGYVAEMAGTSRFASLMESRILRPAGMSRSTFKPLVALTWPAAMGHQIGAGNAMTVVRPYAENTAQWAAGFLIASVPELARFTIALMNDGQLDGQAIYSPGAIRRLTTGYVTHPGGSGLDSARYGYGLVVGSAMIAGKRERVWTHGGAIDGFTASVTMLPDRKAALIVLMNGPGASSEAIERAAFAAIGAARVASAPPAARALTAAELAPLVGRYAMGGVEVSIASNDGAAVVRQGPLTMPLTMLADGSLMATLPTGATRRFWVQRAGARVEYLHTSSRALARMP